MTVFEDIYKRNAWRGPESRSGPGSGAAATHHVATAIRELVAELGATSVLDVGCGDGYWMPDLPGYVGVDASRWAIKAAIRRHPTREYRHDIPVRPFDVAVCRDVLQHLSFADAHALLERIDAAWLLASTYVGGVNEDIATGGSYSPDLTAPPFDLGEPDRLIFDGYGYEDADAIRDPRKHLGLWRR